MHYTYIYIYIYGGLSNATSTVPVFDLVVSFGSTLQEGPEMTQKSYTSKHVQKHSYICVHVQILYK